MLGLILSSLSLPPSPPRSKQVSLGWNEELIKRTKVGVPLTGLAADIFHTSERDGAVVAGGSDQSLTISLQPFNLHIKIFDNIATRP